MTKQTKINFMPVVYARPHKHDNKAFVTINDKGSMIFNKTCIEQYNLANKYICFYTDIAKKIIGWQVVNNAQEFKELANKKYRLIKPTRWHTASLSIRHMLQELNIDRKAFYKLKINEYTDLIYNKIYYVTLKK